MNLPTTFNILKQYVMKKFALNAITSSLTLLLFFTACQRSSHEAVTTIEVNNDLKITYSGTLNLNDDKTDFKNISPNGFVHYKRNDKKMTVESSAEGQLVYQLYEGGTKLNLDENGKKFLAETIKDMVVSGAKFK